jgi:hypothetical protein
MENNPEGVESLRARRRCNPVGVENNLGRLPRVVRCAANPGLMDAIPLGLKQRAKNSQARMNNDDSKKTLRLLCLFAAN